MGSSAPRPLDLQPLKDLLPGIYQYNYEPPDDEELVEALRAVLAPVLTVEPCHVTGMHDPTHTERYLCDIQLKEMVQGQLLPALGLTSNDLPKRLHDEGACYWCHGIPSGEDDRAENRRLHEWAGHPIPAELAAPADDAYRPGDEDELYGALSTALPFGETVNWKTLTEVCCEFGVLGNQGRRNRAQTRLEMDRRLQVDPRSNPRVYVLISPDDAEVARQERDADTLLLLTRIVECADDRYGYAKARDIGRLAAGPDDSPKIGYDRYRFAVKWARFTGLADYREHQGWFLTAKGKELVPANA